MALYGHYDCSYVCEKTKHCSGSERYTDKKSPKSIPNSQKLNSYQTRTLRSADFAALTCSKTFTMAEDPKLTLLGKHVPGNLAWETVPGNLALKKLKSLLAKPVPGNA